MADTISVPHTHDDGEHGTTESSAEPDAESTPATASSVRGERFLLGFGIGVLGCTIVAIFLDVMILGVAIGFILGTVLGTYLAMR